MSAAGQQYALGDARPASETLPETGPPRPRPGTERFVKGYQMPARPLSVRRFREQASDNT
jgi:hypothetical protein